jgi:hypothetical protein
MTIKLKKISLTESHKAALLQASDGALTAEAVGTIATTLESLMNAKVKEIALGLSKNFKAHYVKVAKESVKIYSKRQDAKVAKYVNYVVAEWLKKNKPEIKDVIEAKRNKAIVDAIVESMKKVHVKVPGTSAEKIVGKLSTKVEDLSKQLVAATSAVKTNESAVLRLKKMVVLERLARDLTASQREKFVKVAMESRVSDLKKFVESAKIVRESVIGQPAKTDPKPNKKSQDLTTESVIARAARV